MTGAFVCPEKGWVCPRCGKVWAPSVRSCDECNEKTTFTRDFYSWPGTAKDPIPTNTNTSE